MYTAGKRPETFENLPYFKKYKSVKFEIVEQHSQLVQQQAHHEKKNKKHIRRLLAFLPKDHLLGMFYRFSFSQIYFYKDNMNVISFVILE